MRHLKLGFVATLCLFTTVVVLPLPAAAEENTSLEAQESGSKPKEPAARPTYFLLPIEFDSDSGAANGDAVITRVLPAKSIPIGERWRLLNIAIIIVADAPGGRPGSPGNPSSISSPKVFGLGDISDALLFSPQGASWGLGAIFGFPTATDAALGSGQWSAGPAFRLIHKAGPWRLSLLGGNLRSFAGDSDRAGVHQLLLRPIVRRQITEQWFLISAPIITANWNASSDQTWLVPIGGGIGRSFVVGRPVNVSLQYYGNVVRPDGAPRSVIRFGFTFPFPVSGRP